MPGGPWLLVVGMHRSGTSAITGALGELGLSVPVLQDRFEPTEDNPDHWESRALGLHDDRLLQRLGGTWDGPPPPQSDSDAVPDLDDPDLGDPAEAARTAFPDAGPIAWKDPRVCLLLPYWLAHLPDPVAAVFVWRAPLSVAHSLQVRDGMTLADGVALWERYNRAALAGLTGVDTFVLRYESIVEDPLGGLAPVAAWLASLPQFAAHAPQWDLSKAAASISPQLNRQRAPGGDEPLLDEHRQLLAHLEAIDGPYRPFTDAPPGTESAWTTALLDDRCRANEWRDTLTAHVAAAETLAREVEAERQAVELERQAEARERQALELDLKTARLAFEGSQTELANVYEIYERMKGSTSWKVTRPLRQVVAALNDRKGTAPAD
jgi:hypothetical protein